MILIVGSMVAGRRALEQQVRAYIISRRQQAQRGTGTEAERCMHTQRGEAKKEGGLEWIFEILKVYPQWPTSSNKTFS